MVYFVEPDVPYKYDIELEKDGIKVVVSTKVLMFDGKLIGGEAARVECKRIGDLIVEFIKTNVLEE